MKPHQDTAQTTTSPPPAPKERFQKLTSLRQVRSELKHRFNVVNIGYLSAVNLLTLLAFIPFVYAPEGFVSVMVIYGLIHLSLALISTTAYAHRLISHSATRQVSASVHLFFGYLGQTLAVQGSLASWAGKHRVHHAVDGHERHEEDPYSAVWFTSAWRNFLWSHVLCYCFESPHEAGVFKSHTEGVLKQHPMMRLQHSHYLIFLIFFTKLTPLALGWWLGGSFWAGLCLLWTSIIAISCAQHITWTVNSVTHMWGVDAARSSAKNNYLWLLPLGEGNHHADHHDAPTDYRNGFGLSGWLLDPTRYVLLALRQLRLVGPLKRTSQLVELRLMVERKLQGLQRKRERLERRAAQASELLDDTQQRARELWTHYEGSLSALKEELYTRAQRLESLKRQYAQLKRNGAQSLSLSAEQLKAQLQALKVELKRAQRELSIELRRFSFELKAARASLAYLG